MSMSPFRLVVTSPTQTYSCTTSSTSIKIGRSLTCEFNIPKEDLSREHCLFEIENGSYFITDLDSKNGICIDRERIAPNKRISVNQDSHIVLSNIYTLKINALEIKSKSEMLGRRDDPELETVSFAIDELPELAHQTYKTRAKRNSKKVTSGAQKKVSENLKMIIGFFLVLAYIIYQARGR